LDEPAAKVRFHPRLRLLVSVSCAHDLFRCWGLTGDGRLELVAAFGSNLPIRPFEGSVAFGPRSDLAAFARPGHPVELRTLPACEPARSIGGNPHGYYAAEFSESETFVALGSAGGGRTEVVEVASEKAVGAFWNSSTLVKHPEGEILAAISDGQAAGVVKFVRLTDSLRCHDVLFSAFPGIAAFAFSPTGDAFCIIYAAIAARDQPFGFQVHEFPSCALRFERAIGTLGKEPDWVPLGVFYPFPLERVLFTPDLRHVLCPHHEGDVVEYRLSDGSESRRWPAHRGMAMSMDARPDLGLLATSGEDATIKLWQWDYPNEIPPVAGRRVTQEFIRNYRVVDPNYYESLLKHTDGTEWFN
jgi:hypothetical protein